MKNKILIVGSLCALFLISFVIYTKSEQLEILYIRVFKKTRSIIHTNENGQLNGRAVFYKDGNIVQEANFINGLKEGWALKFYENGQILSKIFYKNDKENGEEYEYFENGATRYVGNWKNGRRYGSLNYYNEDGKLQAYHGYDILGQKFNIVWYNRARNVSDYKGHILSNRIYSYDIRDSLNVFERGTIYYNLKDLYLAAATPPGLGVSIIVKINDVQQNNLSMENNTIKISNVLEKEGTYKIEILDQVRDKNNKIFENSSFEKTIVNKRKLQ